MKTDRGKFSMGPTTPLRVFWKSLELFLFSRWLGGTIGNKQGGPRFFTSYALLRIVQCKKRKESEKKVYFLSNNSPDLHTCEKPDYNYLNLDTDFILQIKYLLHNLPIY